MACGLSRLVPRIVPPTVRMPESEALSSILRPVFHQTAKAITEADHFHTITSQDGLADTPNSRIQPGTVTAGRQQTDDLFMFEILSAAAPRIPIALRSLENRYTLIILGAIRIADLPIHPKRRAIHDPNQDRRQDLCPYDLAAWEQHTHDHKETGHAKQTPSHAACAAKTGPYCSARMIESGVEVSGNPIHSPLTPGPPFSVNECRGCDQQRRYEES